MKELRKKTFKNGVVYCLQLEDGFLVETTRIHSCLITPKMQ